MSSDKPRETCVGASCVCATRGFFHPLWNEVYYPPECPVEWRIAYFMNDFQAVYLEAVEWYEQPDQLRAIVDELEDDCFEFVLEWPTLEHGRQIQQVLKTIVPLRKHIACIVLDIDTLPDSLVREICDALNGRFPINFKSRAAAEERRELTQHEAAGFVWKPAQSTELSAAGRYQVVSLPCLELRAIKAVLQQVRPLLDQGVRVGLFLDADRLTPQRALEVRTVIELMGLT